jgi:glycosyltransferase involved in cell wall biosynthesis
MRILYLNHNVVGRGTWVRAAGLARELVGHGHHVTVLTTSLGTRMRSREYEWHGVHVIEAPDLLAGPARTGWDAWNTSWRVQRLARERFDLVHGFDCRPVVIVPALAQRRRTGAPLFLDWADWWGRGGTIMERSSWPVRTFFGPVETWLEESFREGATANTTINDALRARCAGLGVSDDRILTLPNGCVAQPRISRDAARRQLALGQGPLILHVGVMQKGDAAFLFDAFRRVLRALPDARLALVGSYAGGVPADVERHVIRTGFVDDTTLRAWLAAADTGVIPLRDTVASRGRWPGKLSDYLAAGLPVVMPAVGSAAALVAAARAARTCEATAGALGDTLVGVLADEPGRHELAEHGRQLAEGELAWSRLAHRLLQFYTKWLEAS